MLRDAQALTRRLRRSLAAHTTQSSACASVRLPLYAVHTLPADPHSTAHTLSNQRTRHNTTQSAVFISLCHKNESLMTRARDPSVSPPGILELVWCDLPTRNSDSDCIGCTKAQFRCPALHTAELASARAAPCHPQSLPIESPAPLAYSRTTCA